MTQTRPFTDRSYSEFLREEQLMGGRCDDCGSLFVPPRALCPDCHGDAMSWEQASGRGHLVAMTRMAMVSPGLADEGFGGDRPYCSGVVELEEGPRVVARLAGRENDEPDEMEVGQEMLVGFEHHDRQTPRLVFRPA